MSRKILFFGNERLATGVTTKTPVFAALVESGFDVSAVILSQAETSPSRNAQTLEIINQANQHGVPVINPGKLTMVIDELKSYEAEIGVLVAYSQIVPPEVITLFPKGIINLHPSLLPKHRGPIPIESVILNGEKQTGVSLMQLGSELDSGPIYSQLSLNLEGNETKQYLADKLGDIGAQLIIDKLPAILDNQLPAVAQTEEPVKIDKKISRDDSRLDFHKSALQLEREVRAYSGWPRSRTAVNGLDITVVKAHVSEGQGEPGKTWHEANQFGFYATDGILVIDELTPSGRQRMPAEAFLAGYKLDS